MIFRTRGSSRLATAVAAAAALSLGVPAGATLPVGDQFRVSAVGIDGDPARGAVDAAIAYNARANEYMVAYVASGLANAGKEEVYVQRLSPSGVLLGAALRVSHTGLDADQKRDGTQPAIAYNPAADEYLVAWRADALATDNEYEVFGQRVSAAGAEVGGDFRVSNAGADGDASRGASRPAVAYGGTANEFLVTWLADALATDNEDEVFGQRVSAAGTEVGVDFRISNVGADADLSRAAFRPAVAFGETANEFLVTWRADGLATDNEYEVFAQRVSAAGTEIGTDFRVSNVGADGDGARGANDPSVAYNSLGNEFLVAFAADALATDNEYEVFAQRVSAAGTEVGGDFRVSTTGGDGDASRGAQSARVVHASRANEYLVAWEADGLAADGDIEVFAQRVSSAGAELGTDFRVSTTGIENDPARSALNVAPAYNSQTNEYMLAWDADGLPTDNEREIWARRSGAGAALDLTAPAVTKAKLAPSRVVRGPRLLTVGKKAKGTSALTFALSEKATVTIRFYRQVPGKKAGRRCLPLPKGVKPLCTRTLAAGAKKLTLAPGAHRIAFSGRLRKAAALPPGRYFLTIDARDAAGNGSTQRTVRFTVV